MGGMMADSLDRLLLDPLAMILATFSDDELALMVLRGMISPDEAAEARRTRGTRVAILCGEVDQ